MYWMDTASSILLADLVAPPPIRLLLARQQG